MDSSGTRHYVFDSSTEIAETDQTGAFVVYDLPDVGFARGGSTYYRMHEALGSTTTAGLLHAVSPSGGRAI